MLILLIHRKVRRSDSDHGLVAYYYLIESQLPALGLQHEPKACQVGLMLVSIVALPDHPFLSGH